MKRTFKKTIAALIAATTMAVGMSSLGASAADFKVSHVNVPGAPSSESKTANVTVAHRSAGATATVSSCYNTDGSGTTGKTYFNCVTYSNMGRVTIENLGAATLKPSIGNPSVDINITYKVSASTPNSQNVFWSSGSIVKKS